MPLFGLALLGIDLEAACKKYEEEYGGKKQLGGPGHAHRHQFEIRAFRVRERGPAVGRTVAGSRGVWFPDQRVFILATATGREDHRGHGRYRDSRG